MEIAAEEEKNGGKKKIDNPGIDPIANREEGEALVERIKDLPFVSHQCWQERWERVRPTFVLT